MSDTIPTIKTERLVLRPFNERDAEPLHTILGVEGVLRYFPSTDPPSLEGVQRLVTRQTEHWHEHGLGWWAVEPRHTSQLTRRRTGLTRRATGLIGWCGLQHLPETDQVEVAYLLDKDLWGQGLATEGALASLHFGFNTLNLETIIALVHPENRASQCVIEKLDMSFVDKLHMWGIDLYRYSIDSSTFHQ
jgi:ribosomal-protein-alanine N-acetyltransferase